MNYSLSHCLLPWDSRDLCANFSLCMVKLFFVQHGYDFKAIVININTLSAKNLFFFVFVFMTESLVSQKCQGNMPQSFFLFCYPRTTTLKSKKISKKLLGYKLEDLKVFKNED